MPSLLPPEKEAEIARNLKTYSKKYDEEDEALLMQADADVLQVGMDAGLACTCCDKIPPNRP